MNRICALVVFTLILLLFPGCVENKQNYPQDLYGIPPGSLKAYYEATCRKIAAQDIQDRCYASMYNNFKKTALNTRNTSWCDKILWASNQDSCVGELAVALNDTKPCEKLFGNSRKKNCEDTVASFRNDSLCKYNEDGINCYLMLLRYTFVCNYNENEERRQECKLMLTTLTNATLDEKLIEECSKQTEVLKDSCFNGLASKLEDVSVCNLLNTTDKTDNCRMALIDAQGLNETYNLGVCDSIIDQQKKDSCFYTLGIVHFKAEICQKVSNLNTRDSCFQEIANERKDKYICNGISRMENQISCWIHNW